MVSFTVSTFSNRCRQHRQHDVVGELSGADAVVSMASFAYHREKLARSCRLHVSTGTSLDLR